MKFLHTREVASSRTPHHINTPPLHTKNGAPRIITSKATTPSAEGHKDLKRSGSLIYKGNAAKSLKVLKLKGLNLTRMRYSIVSILALNDSIGWMECINTFDNLS
jgi:hypothetical protein